MKLTINNVSIESCHINLGTLLDAVAEKIIEMDQVVEVLKFIGINCQESEFFLTKEKTQEFWKELGNDIVKFAEQMEEKIKKAGY